MSLKIICYLTLLFCIGIAGCKDKKPTTDTTQKPPTSAELLSGKIADNELAANWLSATLQIDANDGSRSQAFAADMRWHKNEAVWFSIYPNFGIKIEVARALVTPDSVRVLDRFNKKYYAHPISYLQTLVGYPVDFNTLQRIMSGGRLLAPDLPTRTDTLPDAFVLTTDRNTLHETIKLNRTDYTASQLLLSDDSTKQTLQISMSKYQPLNDRAFSHERKIAIQSTIGGYNADIDFSGVTIHANALEMPFSVSSKYSKQWCPIFFLYWNEYTSQETLLSVALRHINLPQLGIVDRFNIIAASICLQNSNVNAVGLAIFEIIIAARQYAARY